VSRGHRRAQADDTGDGGERIRRVLNALTASGAAIDREIALLAVQVRSAHPLASRPHMQRTSSAISARARG
jgi:hypothetical protein